MSALADRNHTKGSAFAESSLGDPEAAAYSRSGLFAGAPLDVRVPPSDFGARSFATDVFNKPRASAAGAKPHREVPKSADHSARCRNVDTLRVPGPADRPLKH